MASIARIHLHDVTLSCAVEGDPKAPLVIAAHGFPDDATTFRAQVPALVAKGLRVACPTMRGYAPSSPSSHGRYHAAALGGDLLGIADTLSPNDPVRLVGHDWGAVASYAAVGLAPHRFSHLVTMAVPHAGSFVENVSRAQLKRSWYMGFFQLRGLADRRLAEDDFALIDRLWRDWSPGYRASAAELRAVKDGIAGREREVLGYYRALLSPAAIFGQSREVLFSKVRVPALHLHGADDGCVGAESARGAERFFTAGYEVSILSGAGHFLQREKPDEVNEKICAFLTR